MNDAANRYAPPAAELTEPSDLTAPYFAISSPELILMSAATLGVYPACWSYKDWRAINKINAENGWPIARAIFSTFTNFPLFARIQAEAARAGAHSRAPHELFALAYFATTIAGAQLQSDESPFGLVFACLAGCFYLPSNSLAQRMNLAIAPKARPIAPWTPLNVIAAFIGLGLIVIALIGWVLPGDLE